MELYSPETTIIKQYEESTDMYYIITGDCTIHIKDYS